MLPDNKKLMYALAIALVALACGAATVVAELFNAPPEGYKLLGRAFSASDTAQRLFIFFFGVVHVLIAAIITVFRRTAV